MKFTCIQEYVEVNLNEEDNIELKISTTEGFFRSVELSLDEAYAFADHLVDLLLLAGEGTDA